MIKFKEVELDAFLVAGISVRTINKEGKSQKDIGDLWDEFIKNRLLTVIPNKISDDIYCIYTDYESDFTGEYTTLLGCKVASGENLPVGLTTYEVPASKYRVYESKGQIPESVGKTWMHIWQTPDTDRAYKADFDVYGKESHNPQEDYVLTYVSIK